MFYRADEAHGLAHNPFKAIVAPRPIGWISTISTDGIANLAPYSFFNAISDTPMMVMFASGGVKDSARNAQETGVFTYNFVSHSARDVMNVTSAPAPPNQSEFELAGLPMVAGETVPCPRVRDVPAALECQVTNIIQPDTISGDKAAYVVVIGEVTGIFIDDNHIADGRFDLAKADPIMRAGYRDYMRGGKMLELSRPGGDPNGPKR
jgi:flavin reductase (DIM6/NTAB) family NADH-FMN oxidoreductase RutF